MINYDSVQLCREKSLPVLQSVDTCERVFNFLLGAIKKV